ncbi:MAG: hypothetical protein R3E84_18145 [Pseudomonadales bacterium]
MANACDQGRAVHGRFGDKPSHFTTIADFVATLGDEIARLFQESVAGLPAPTPDRQGTVCDRWGEIALQRGQVRSGTRADFERPGAEDGEAVKAMMKEHRRLDDAGETEASDRMKQQAARLKKETKQVREWLSEHPKDRTSAKGAVRLSNRTDNESAKMATDKGSGTGLHRGGSRRCVASSDCSRQADGSGSEQETLFGGRCERRAPYAEDGHLCGLGLPQ